MMFHQQSILPEYDVFAEPPQTLPQFGRPPLQAPSVDPRMALVSPAVAAYQMAQGTSVRGLGQAGGAGTGMSLGVAIIVLLAGGYLGYQAGKAMTPSGSSEKTWGWVGVPVGMFTGTLGLGIMGMVSNARD